MRARGGFTILRACEAIVAAHASPLAPGSAWVTTAGDLPAKAVIHCVASDARHHSSPAIVRACVANALLRAAEANCRSVAFPLFATGHARLAFDQALRVIVQELREATLDHAWIVINDRDRIEETTRVIQEVFPGDTEVEMSAATEERSSWFGD